VSTPQSVRRPSFRPPAEDAPLWSNRIRVTEEVGRGAMGYVLRGTDTKLRRELALKVSPLPRDQLPRGQLARFVEEAQITAQLEHPNVVPVHDISIDPDGRVYFSMKLIRGQSLEAILGW
jgi:serine/threonine protein kinase